jgi:predicted small secreted protein
MAGVKLSGMNYLIVLAALLALNSCNTCIGIGRDTKQAYLWTKEKIQGTGSNTSGDASGAPVY